MVIFMERLDGGGRPQGQPPLPKGLPHAGGIGPVPCGIPQPEYQKRGAKADASRRDPSPERDPAVHRQRVRPAADGEPWDGRHLPIGDVPGQLS